MKATFLFALLISTSSLAFAQSGNVGIGTSTPGTKLDVVGALTLRQVTVHVDSAFGGTSAYTFIPPNVSQVSLIDSAADTIHVEAPVPAFPGQILTIFNNTTGSITFGTGPQAARMNGYMIPAGRSLTFRSNGTTAASFKAENYVADARDIGFGGSTIHMLASDYFVVLSFGSSRTYVLDNPPTAGNKGRTVVIYNGNFSSSMTISSNSGSQILNTGSSYGATTSSFSLSGSTRTMLICDGTYWIRIF